MKSNFSKIAAGASEDDRVVRPEVFQAEPVAFCEPPQVDDDFLGIEAEGEDELPSEPFDVEATGRDAACIIAQLVVHDLEVVTQASHPSGAVVGRLVVEESNFTQVLAAGLLGRHELKADALVEFITGDDIDVTLGFGACLSGENGESELLLTMCLPPPLFEKLLLVTQLALQEEPQAQDMFTNPQQIAIGIDHIKPFTTDDGSVHGFAGCVGYMTFGLEFGSD